MATALHVQTPEDFSPAAEYSSPWLDRPVAPREEAISLFALIGRNGDTVESVRELIAIPTEIESALLLYAKRNPEDARGIERVMQFRRRVAEEFEQLAVRSDSGHASAATENHANAGTGPGIQYVSTSVLDIPQGTEAYSTALVVLR